MKTLLRILVGLMNPRLPAVRQLCKQAGYEAYGRWLWDRNSITASTITASTITASTITADKLNRGDQDWRQIGKPVPATWVPRSLTTWDLYGDKVVNKWYDLTVVGSAYEQQASERGEWRHRPLRFVPRYDPPQGQGEWTSGPAPDIGKAG